MPTLYAEDFPRFKDLIILVGLRSTDARILIGVPVIEMREF